MNKGLEGSYFGTVENQTPKNATQRYKFNKRVMLDSNISDISPTKPYQTLSTSDTVSRPQISNSMALPSIKSQKDFSNLASLSKLFPVNRNLHYSNLNPQSQINSKNELLVKNLATWEDENLKFKIEKFDTLLNNLMIIYQAKNNKKGVRELNEFNQIMAIARSLNLNFKHSSLSGNKALNNIFLRTRQEEGAILLNSITKTSSRFNSSLLSSNTQKQIGLDLHVDLGSLNALKNDRNEIARTNGKYRQVISEKQQQENILRDALIRVYRKLNIKRAEKNKTKEIIEKLYSERFELNEDLSNAQIVLKDRKRKLQQEEEMSKKSKGKDFADMLKMIGQDNLYTEKIKELKLKMTNEDKIFNQKKAEYTSQLNIIQKEEEFYKYLSHTLLKEQKDYYYNILKNGYDVREEGLVWVLKHLIEMNCEIDYSKFPNFLDREQVDYLVTIAKSQLNENLMTMLENSLRKKQKNTKKGDELKMYYKITHSKTIRKASRNVEENSSNVYIEKEFEKLKEKYRYLFNKENKDVMGESKMKEIINRARECLMIGEEYKDDKEEIFNKFFGEDSLNKFEMEVILELRNAKQEIKKEREKMMKKMFLHCKKREEIGNRYMSAKQSLQCDLIFSALFGSNFCI